MTRLHRDAARLGGSVAEGIFERAISLPSSSSLTDAQQLRVVAALEVAGRIGRVGAARG
jgi:dTDP-4-amino-4,6-dideoxygalactose transaminase